MPVKIHLFCRTCGKKMEDHEMVFNNYGTQRKDCRECFLAIKRIQSKKLKQSDPEKYRKKGSDALLKFNYGITREEYDALLLIQNGVCAVCKQKCTTGQALSVDHNHKTNKIRGLLCRKCNMAIGLLNDSEIIAFAVFEYLTKNIQVIPESEG